LNSRPCSIVVTGILSDNRRSTVYSGYYTEDEDAKLAIKVGCDIKKLGREAFWWSCPLIGAI